MSNFLQATWLDCATGRIKCCASWECSRLLAQLPLPRLPAVCSADWHRPCTAVCSPCARGLFTQATYIYLFCTRALSMKLCDSQQRRHTRCLRCLCKAVTASCWLVCRQTGKVLTHTWPRGSWVVPMPACSAMAVQQGRLGSQGALGMYPTPRFTRRSQGCRLLNPRARAGRALILQPALPKPAAVVAWV